MSLHYVRKYEPQKLGLFINAVYQNDTVLVCYISDIIQ